MSAARGDVLPETSVHVPEEPASGVRAVEPRRVRARSIRVNLLRKSELEQLRSEYPPEEHADVPRPRTRGDCERGPRPCPWVSCHHHLYLDVLRSGSIKVNFPDHEPDELEHSCALDVADDGPHRLERVGEIMNLSRERARQVQESALAKLASVRELVDEHGTRRAVVRLRMVGRGTDRGELEVE